MHKIKKAERRNLPLFIGLAGLSGTGKTYSSLLLARGIVGDKGKILMVDTEYRRSEYYAEVTDFDVLDLSPPFTPERCKTAIDQGIAAGYDIIIFDSFSHEWYGQGGIIDMADNQVSKWGKPLKGLSKWKKPKEEHRDLVEYIRSRNVNFILCFRAKYLTKSQTGADGKEEIVTSPTPVAIQEKDTPFELTVNLLMKGGGHFDVLKCPEGLQSVFATGRPLSIDTGKKAKEWSNTAAPADFDSEELLNRARNSAKYGVEIFREQWLTFEKYEREALKPHLDDLQNIAEESDRVSGSTTTQPDDKIEEADFEVGVANEQ